MEPANYTPLVRGIRRWDLVAVVINIIIGAGILGLPSRVYSLIGPYSLIAFLVSAVYVALIIFCFAEVGSRFTETGGPYLYAREAFGPTIGFEVGWLSWLARLTAFATNCNLLVSYLSYFWPGVGSGAGRVVLITAIVVSLATVNMIGIRETAILTNLFTVGKLIPLALFTGVGLFFINPQNFSTATPPAYGAFSTAILLLVYAFSGFEVATIPAGEIQNPQRNLPFALITSIGIVALLYFLIQAVCIGTLPELAHSEKPLADASGRFLGAAGASTISVGAVISLTGNINSIVLAGSRLPFAMAEQHQLPQVLSATHRRFRTPHLSILVTTAIMLALTISSTFIYALTLSTLTRLIVYSTTCAALPILRRRSDVRPAMFKAPAGFAISIAVLVLAAWLLSNSTWREARDLAIAAAVGMFIYTVYRLGQRRPPPERASGPADTL